MGNFTLDLEGMLSSFQFRETKRRKVKWLFGLHDLATELGHKDGTSKSWYSSLYIFSASHNFSLKYPRYWSKRVVTAFWFVSSLILKKWVLMTGFYTKCSEFIFKKKVNVNISQMKKIPTENPLMLLCVVSSYPQSKPLANPDLFSIPMVLPFLECHTMET